MNGDWVKEGLIRSLGTDWGFIGFRGDRDVRQMVSDGLLEKRKVGKFTEVRTKFYPRNEKRVVNFSPARENKVVALF